MCGTKVVPGTIETSDWARDKMFNNDDFPAFGNPTYLEFEKNIYKF